MQISGWPEKVEELRDVLYESYVKLLYCCTKQKKRYIASTIVR
jgi:hypothetical protein